MMQMNSGVVGTYLTCTANELSVVLCLQLTLHIERSCGDHDLKLVLYWRVAGKCIFSKHVSF